MATRGRRQYVGLVQNTYCASKVSDLASIAAGAQNTAVTVSIPGVTLSRVNRVSVMVPISAAALDISGYVSANDTVTLLASNNSGGAIDLASTTFYVLVEEFDVGLFS
jgi:hypothetical protein